MGRKFIKMNSELESPSKLFDDDLENDAVDLEEWAFWQGYNEED